MARDEVVIIGGGPAGSVCALALAHRGHQVTLFNTERASGWRAGEMVGPKVRQLLAREFGLDVPADAALPLKLFHSYWGRSEPTVRSFEFWSTQPAQVLRRPAFDRVLIAAAKLAGVEVVDSCSISGCDWDGSRWHVIGLRSGSEFRLTASILIEAVGARTRSLALADITRLFFDNQVCLSIETGTASNSEGAIVETCALGWWYVCPIERGRQIVSLFTDADLLAGPNRETFIYDQLAKTEFVAKHIVWHEHDSVRVSNARTSARSVLWRNRWIPAGDAAFSLDPVSGTGIERALTDGMAVAEAVSSCVADGDEGRLRSHAVQTAAAFQQSLLQRRAIYAMERRWKDHPFWQRRSYVH